MPNKIEVYQHDGVTVRARLLFPRKVEVTISLAPGDDPAAILLAEHARLAPTYAALPENPADDPPSAPKPASDVYDGTAWSKP
jgi:hypothetical protein